MPSSTGTKCFFELPYPLADGDDLILKVERQPVETTTHRNATYAGHVWNVLVGYRNGARQATFMRQQFGLDSQAKFFTLGRILLTDENLAVGDLSPGGITSFSNFNEHIGCTPCESFGFEVNSCF